VPFSVLELIIYLVFGFWLFLKVKNNGLRFLSFKCFGYERPIFLIFLGVTLSTLFSVCLNVSAGIWKGWFLAPLLFLVVLTDVIRARKQIRDLLAALTLSGAATAIISIFYWLNNDLTYDGRLKAFYLSANHLAMYLSPILILSFFLFFLVKRKVFKFLLILVYTLLILVIYLTFSYGAWLGLLIALVFVLVVNKKKKVVFLGALLAICLMFFVQFPSDKFQAMIDFAYPSLNSRLVIWQSAWEIIKDHPLIGIGPGLFQKYYLNYQPRFEPYLEWAVPQPHNLFLAFWLQTGLIGLIGFGWLLIVFFAKNLKKNRSIFDILLMAVMVYILTHGLIDTPYWKNDLSIIFWLIIGLSYRSKLFHFQPSSAL
jgi:O-antigen ligase